MDLYDEFANDTCEIWCMLYSSMYGYWDHRYNSWSEKYPYSYELQEIVDSGLVRLEFTQGFGFDSKELGIRVVACTPREIAKCRIHK